MTNAIINEGRAFGVELEVVKNGNFDRTTFQQEVAQALCDAGITTENQNYNHNTQSCWKIVYDSSIHVYNGVGFELVSPKLYGQAGLAEIRKVCQVLNGLGMTVNKSCGLHVHHDASDYKTKHLERIVKFYARSEKQIDLIMAPSRRGDTNTYCRSLSQVITYSDTDRIVLRGQSRYYKLNIQSYYRHGTVEFRQHQGTVDADKIIAWVAFTQAIVERCKRAIKESTHALTWYDLKQATGMVHKPEMHEVAQFLDARREWFALRDRAYRAA